MDAATAKPFAPASRPSRPPAPQFDNIPRELKSRSRWLCWRYGEPQPNGKFPKVPCNQHGRKCDYTQPTVWMPFDRAVLTYRQGGYDGIGFVLGDGICGLDEDHRFHDHVIDPTSLFCLERLNSYAEVSVSGDGVHVLAFGRLPGEHRKSGPHEMYSENRFFVVTGQKLPNAPATIEYRDKQLGEVYEMIFGTQDSGVTQSLPNSRDGGNNNTSLVTAPVPKLSDERVLAMILRDKAACRYWRGYPVGVNPSEADFAIACKLAFYTAKNIGQMERLFRQSGLYGRKKHKSKRGNVDYVRYTLLRACKAQKAVWHPRRLAKKVAASVGRPLSQATQEVLALHLEQPELKPSEIAQRLALNSGAVRVILHRHRRNAQTARRRAA